MTAKIIAVSENEAKEAVAIGISRSRLAVVYNGIRQEPPNYTPVAWEDQRLKVLFVGRLDRQKGVDVLYNAIKGLEDKITVRIVGNTILRDAYLSFADLPHVACLGWRSVSEVSAQIAVADVLVMPSRWEGFPLVIPEAMRLHKPLIATRVGGVPEAIIDGETGFLFESGDHAALRRILLTCQKDKLKIMGDNGHALFVERFLSGRMGEEIIKLYRSITAF